MDIEDLRNEYIKRIPLFTRLNDEALFILNPAIEKKRIKLHSLTSRIKEWDSFLTKVQRKEQEEQEKGKDWESTKAFEDIRDIVGIRVVCLFLSDIATISDVIRESFSVLVEDNKVEGVDASSFGYMSVHFLLKSSKMPQPRQSPIKNLISIVCKHILQ